jgi:hypothetical protein
MARHFSGRTTKLWTCYECKIGEHDRCSDTARQVGHNAVCHCTRCSACTAHGLVTLP